MVEVWKDIPGHEGFYQVSDLGRVKEGTTMNEIVQRKSQGEVGSSV
jgi:hypothetical protein